MTARRKAPPPPSAFTSTDGGKSAAGFVEHNDCSVRAYAIAYGVPYDVAHEAFRRAGRRTRGRTKHWVSILVMGAPTRRFLRPMPTFAQWLREHQVGHYVVHTRGHALAVVNGVHHDLPGMYKPRARVQQFWRITRRTT